MFLETINEISQAGYVGFKCDSMREKDETRLERPDGLLDQPRPYAKAVAPAVTPSRTATRVLSRLVLYGLMDRPNQTEALYKAETPQTGHGIPFPILLKTFFYPFNNAPSFLQDCALKHSRTHHSNSCL